MTADREKVVALCRVVLREGGFNEAQINSLGYGEWPEYEQGTYPEEDRWKMERYEDHEER